MSTTPSAADEELASLSAEKLCSLSDHHPSPRQRLPCALIFGAAVFLLGGLFVVRRVTRKRSGQEWESAASLMEKASEYYNGTKCSDGYYNDFQWVDDWSDSRKSYCCHNFRIACPSAVPDCSVGYDDLGEYEWVSGWPTAKKIYCCRTVHRGCPLQVQPHVQPAQFDCNSDGQDKDLEWHWSPNKLEYCCKNKHKGCLGHAPPLVVAPMEPPSTNTSYDCNAGYRDLHRYQWAVGWAEAKRDYCCRRFSKGCPSELPSRVSAMPDPVTFKYDCNADYHHECTSCMKHLWSAMKLKYCCEVEHKGCQSNAHSP
jgi:hypothetical protein